MRGEENANPIKSSKVTSPLHWDPEMVAEGNACCTFLSRLGFPPHTIAILIHGENVVDIECVKPRTVELYHKLMMDIISEREATDANDRKLFGMMVEESTLLFTHALDEDIAAWNRLRSGC